MGNRFASLVTSKGYIWFWFVFSATFFVLDIATGHLFAAILMLALSVYNGWMLAQIYNGTSVAYNRYHGKKV